MSERLLKMKRKGTRKCRHKRRVMTKKGRRTITVGNGPRKKRIKKQYKKSFSSYFDYNDDEDDGYYDKDENLRKYGLSSSYGFGNDPQIIEEKDGIALVQHTDSESPASESSTTYEIRREGGQVLYDSGIVYQAEFSGGGSAENYAYKEAKKEFDKLVKRKKIFGMAVVVERKSTKGKHMGDETNDEVRSLYNLKPTNGKYESFPEGHMKYAFENITEDKGDIINLKVINPGDDTVAFEWQKGKGTTFPRKEDLFPPALDNRLSKDKLKEVKKLRDDE